MVSVVQQQLLFHSACTVQNVLRGLPALPGFAIFLFRLLQVSFPSSSIKGRGGGECFFQVRGECENMFLVGLLVRRVSSFITSLDLRSFCVCLMSIEWTSRIDERVPHSLLLTL